MVWIPGSRWSCSASGVFFVLHILCFFVGFLNFFLSFLLILASASCLCVIAFWEKASSAERSCSLLMLTLKSPKKFCHVFAGGRCILEKWAQQLVSKASLFKTLLVLQLADSAIGGPFPRATSSKLTSLWSVEIFLYHLWKLRSCIEVELHFPASCISLASSVTCNKLGLVCLDLHLCRSLSLTGRIKNSLHRGMDTNHF